MDFIHTFNSNRRSKVERLEARYSGVIVRMEQDLGKNNERIGETRLTYHVSGEGYVALNPAQSWALFMTGCPADIAGKSCYIILTKEEMLRVVRNRDATNLSGLTTRWTGGSFNKTLPMLTRAGVHDAKKRLNGVKFSKADYPRDKHDERVTFEEKLVWEEHKELFPEARWTGALKGSEEFGSGKVADVALTKGRYIEVKGFNGKLEGYYTLENVKRTFENEVGDIKKFIEELLETASKVKAAWMNGDWIEE